MAKKAKSPKNPSPSISPLTDALRSAIEASGKSAYQLREESGVNHGVILRFMKRERDIRLETADRLAMAVGFVWEAGVLKTPAPMDKAEGGGALPRD